MSASHSYAAHGPAPLKPGMTWGEIWPIILATIAVLIVCIIVPRGVRHAQRALAATQTIREILDSSWLLADQLAQVEREHSSYLLTGRKEFMESYQGAVQAVRSRLALLEQSLQKDSDSSGIRELADLVSRRLAQTDSDIATRDWSDHAAASKVVADESNSQILTGINRAMQSIWAGQRARLDSYRNDANDSREWASIAAVAVAVLCLALLLLEFRNFRVRSLRMRQAVNRMASGEERYRLLSARLQDLREADRLSLAHRVHDEVGQALTVIKLDAHRAANLIGANPEQARNVLNGVQELADTTSRIARSLSMELRPAILDQEGIEAALEWQINELVSRTSTKIGFRSDLSVSLALPQQVAMFRIAQEAFTNILRHSQAHSVTVVLTQEGDAVLLRISDDGIGIPVERIHDSTSLGLVGMQERADAIGAALTVQYVHGGGTAVTLSVPLRAQQISSASAVAVL